ncbi:MAG: hypothetical protein FWC23_04810 [Chitinispirillia bacterium]|nr:hypothetical protein [Chitinispirillia bacterium]MCL2268487.1 hypothetical protein [Chitinispirillia bacterium]
MSIFKGMSKLARCCLAVIAAVSMTAAAQNIMEISSCADLQKIGKLAHADYPLSGNYVLTGDIDLSGCLNTETDIGAGRQDNKMGWAPVGQSVVWYGTMPMLVNGTPLTPPRPHDSTLFAGAFRGTFDGNGHTIRGLYVNRKYKMIEDVDASVLSGGLFGSLDGAEIKNLTIEADTVAVAEEGGPRRAGAGILAGFSRASAITNVHVRGTVAVTTSSYMRDSSFYDVSAGGLVGQTGGLDSWHAWPDNITGSSAAVTVISLCAVPVSKIGGLVGIGLYSVISGSYAKTEIIGTGVSAGGLIGENRSGTITKSGAAASMENYSIVNFRNLGGLAGGNIVSGIHPPYCECTAIHSTPGVITQSYSTVKLYRIFNNSVMMGGLAGYDEAGVIENCYSTGTIVSEEMPLSPPVGSGKSMGTDGMNVIIGGLVGYTRYWWPQIPITGPARSIERSYAAIAISGYASIQHGLVGYTNKEKTAEQPLSGKTAASSDDILPDILAYNTCYWNMDISDGDERYGIIKTTAEMYRQATFAGWDFNDIWRIKEGEGYPYLAWQDDGASSISWNRTAKGAGNGIFAPSVTVRGRTLSVKAPPAAELQVRLMDVRGRTLARFAPAGGVGSFSLTQVAAGRYFVDVRDVRTGRRAVSAVVLR